MRVVLDTNVFIDSAKDEHSAGARLLDDLKEGKVTAVASSAVTREYNKIITRLIQTSQDKERVQDALQEVQPVDPKPTTIQIDDEEDRKFIEAALGGDATAIITSDRHLLDIGEIAGVRMMRPEELINTLEEETSSAWQEIVKGLGIK